MPKLTDVQMFDKLRHLAKQLVASEDPGACLDCRDGKHLECLYEGDKGHDDACACEFCCGR